MPEQPRALVVKLSSLGDLFHPLPAVHQLKQALNLSIDWVTQPEYHDLVACFTDVEHVMDYPRHNFIPAFSPFFKKMRRKHYDFVFDFQGLFKSGLTSRMAKAERRIGPAYYREGANIYYDEIAGKRDKNRHAVEEALDFVRHFKLEPVPPVFPVRFPQVEPGGPTPWIALAPCSRWATKNWPPESFARLARLLRERVGGACFIIGGSQDAAVGDREFVASTTGQVHPDVSPGTAPAWIEATARNFGMEHGADTVLVRITDSHPRPIYTIEAWSSTSP